MSLVKIDRMWNVLVKNLYLIKILLLTVLRHYFPVRHKIVDVLKKLTKIEEPVVSIPNGKLRGKLGTNINNAVYYSFQGIPYAKPPVGNLRFKAPQPPERWIGILDATHEGSDCLSRHTVLKTIIGGEDCLTLNVYTPELPKDESRNVLKPVMVWIHGGGFTSGSGSTEAYGPEFLLTGDVVLVTINYRTGILGFFSLEDPNLDVPGNAGLKDMVMALKWIKENIIYFCGDPNNVTVFGESAGAAATHYLILSPMAKGLFHKAILQSGCALNIWAKGRNYVNELAQVLGIPNAGEEQILRILQDLTPEQLYKVAEKVYDPFIACKVRPYAPVIERKSEEAFLYEDPLDIIKAGKYNHVPILLGFTTREGILGEIVQKPAPFKPITNFELCVPHFLNLERGCEMSKQFAQHIKEFYYENEEPSTDNKDRYYLLETDNFFVREILLAMKYHSESSSSPIFLYRMSVETSLNMLKKIYGITDTGVCHADDLGYLFKNLLTPTIEPGSAEDIAIRRFVQLWTNFAKNGDPNPKEQNHLINVKWKPVTKDEAHFLDIGINLTTGVNPEAERMKFWDKIFKINLSNKSLI